MSKSIVITGSIAYDRIMDFPGFFKDNILPDKIHILNVCFVINELKESFGGTAGNICYSLSLLNEKPTLLGVVGNDTRLGIDKDFVEEKDIKHLQDEKYQYEYTFEPSPAEVLDEMIPRLIEVQLFQCLLKANASEHSARMTAMNQATDAATDMIKELTLFYNKARQASITAEIAEISAGANALAD